MAFVLNNIEEAVDGKFLVVKNLTNQADVGTVVHIMGTNKSSDGSVTIDYRVTGTGQDYEARFSSIKDFCNWAKPDSFIARNYDSFTKDEIKNYIKINNRTFASFCLPIMIVILIVAWVLGLAVLKGGLGIGIAIGISVIGTVASIIILKKSKTNVKMKLYKKLSSKWGIEF